MKKIFAFFISLVILLSLSSVQVFAIDPSIDNNENPFDIPEENYYEFILENNDFEDQEFSGELIEPTYDENPVFSEDATSIPISSPNGQRGAWLVFDIVEGSSKKVKATVSSSGSPLFYNNVSIKIYTGTTRSNCNTLAVSSTTFKLYGLRSEYIETNAATKYFKVGITVDGTTYNQGTATKLFNKSGRVYPKYTDPRSGITVPEPSVSWAKTSPPLVSWSATNRNSYLQWYERTYCRGIAQNWSGYEVHHIRPRAYGGTNVNSNLIPLPTNIHSLFTGWFAGY